ncbi:alpha/beta fold hydrolase [Aquirhabdus sp.]|uniref:alpha/beta fold hydrolase n=1 Tax=Aquirhabdus sp. TaxID=2824160 RepID=UPI00396C6285
MFTFPVDTRDLFEERSRQFAKWGMPSSTIRRVQARVNDNWREGPGGWAYEWMQEAEAAERKGLFMQASMIYGAARFPTAVTPLRELALKRQAACFERAADRIPGHFERRHIALACAGGQSVPVHIYAPDDSGKQPLVLLSGGVDSGKSELHRMALLLARVGRFRVAAVDMPGTCESRAAMLLKPDAEQLYLELLRILAPTGPVGVMGVSFGGHWAAKLALMDAVDAVVNFGGPVTVFETGGKFLRSLPNGMPGIVSNAYGLAAMPDDVEIDAIMEPFSLRRQGLLEGDKCSPMLVVNGENDQYIPQHDSRMFARYPGNQVWLMRGMTHCAAEGVARILPAMIAWLRLRLYGETMSTRLLFELTKTILPAHEIVQAD